MKRAFLLFLIIAMLFTAGCSNYYVGNSNPLPTLNPALSENKKPGDNTQDKRPMRQQATVGVVDIDTYFPLGTKNYELSKFLYLVYDPLVKMDSNYKVSFCLADEVYTTDGGITWTINIKNNVKWHNGDAFCVEDVIFTVNSIKTADTLYSHMVKDISEVKKISDTQLTIKLCEPDSTFPSKLIFPVVRNNSETDVFPCGTGMYKFSNVAENGSYVFELNTKYYFQKAAIQKLIFTSYGSECELSESDSDFMIVQQANVLNSILPGKSSCLIQGNTLCTLMPSDTVEALDVNIRKAVFNALDIQAIVKYAISGYAGAKMLPIAENTWFNQKDSSYYPDGFTACTIDSLGYFSPISITICADENNREHVSVAKKCTEQLNQAGFIANYVTYKTPDELSTLKYSFIVKDIELVYSWDFSLAFAENEILSYNITAIENAYMTPNDTGVTDMASFEEYVKSQTKNIAESFYDNLPYIGIYSEYSALLIDEDINGRTKITATAWDPLLGFENLY